MIVKWFLFQFWQIRCIAIFYILAINWTFYLGIPILLDACKAHTLDTVIVLEGGIFFQRTVSLSAQSTHDFLQSVESRAYQSIEKVQ